MVAISPKGLDLERPDLGVKLLDIKDPFRRNRSGRILWCVAEFVPMCIWPRHSASTHWDRLKAKARPGNSGFIHRIFDDVIYVRMDDYL
ncbi:MAG: hypothetical protein WBG50_00450 [Desulfomonilaceae bacterium]